MNSRMIALIAATCLIALLVIDIWQVQQLKMIQHQLREGDQIKTDVQRMLYEQRLAMKKAERAQKTPAPAPQAEAVQSQAAPAEGMPAEAGTLLQQALEGLKRASAANDAGDLAASAAEVGAIKEAVWKAGDMWPKYKEPLHELMAPLDYAVKRLNRGDTADFSQPQKVVAALLRKGQKQ